uniref:Serpentine receptor class gamma n=1 Tax=Meloidogyne floridensis TaxID=298350 RepID=A0A915NFS4_9BILA
MALLPLITFLSQIYNNINALINLPVIYSSYIGTFLPSSLASLIAVLNPIVGLLIQSDLVTILSVRNYRQIIFRCKNNSNINQVAPMPETSMPDRTIQYIS